jgi:hypothetical protein
LLVLPSEVLRCCILAAQRKGWGPFGAWRIHPPPGSRPGPLSGSDAGRHGRAQRRRTQAASDSDSESGEHSGDRVPGECSGGWARPISGFRRSRSRNSRRARRGSPGGGGMREQRLDPDEAQASPPSPTAPGETGRWRRRADRAASRPRDARLGLGLDGRGRSAPPPGGLRGQVLAHAASRRKRGRHPDDSDDDSDEAPIACCSH